MFERYTEKARRVIFFARYEASHFGSEYIQTEHLLLGFLREYPNYRRWAPGLVADEVRNRVDAESPKRPPRSTSVDLPLDAESKRVLKLAADEADRLTHRHIGTEHLLLAMLGVEECFAAKILRDGGADAEKMRARLAKEGESESARLISAWTQINRRVERLTPGDAVEIHGTRRNADYIRDVVRTVRAYNWHWQKADWRPRDIVIHNKDGRISFDLTLAEDKENFTLVKQGWKKDHCFICRWELFESEGEHGIGYTNGRTWLCLECCERFVLGPDFFTSSQSEMT